MRSRRLGLVVLSVGIVGPSVLAAGADEGAVRVGDRIRVEVRSGSERRLVGSLLAANPDELSVALAGPEGHTVRLGRSTIARLEVSRGTKRNVLWGALIGAAAGSAALLVPSGEGEACDFGACVILPVGGAAVGSLVGLAIKTERWTPVPVEGLRVSVIPVRQGVQLSLAVGF